MKTGKWFDRFSKWAARHSGRPGTFVLAAVVIIIWAITGPLFEYSDTWQLVINTGTTIITFLMVFLIQSTQNRDTAAVHLKLDELIRASQGAHNNLLDLEELSEEELTEALEKYQELASKSRKLLERGETDVDSPEVEEVVEELAEETSGKPR